MMSRVLVSLPLLGALQAADLQNPSFDTTPFPTGWTTGGTVASNASITADAGNSALISNGGGIHQDFAETEGLSSFQVTFAFRCGNPASALDRLRLRGNANSGDIVTLRPTANGIDRFSGTWPTSSTLPFPLTAGTSYYLRVTATNFAESSRSYTIGISTNGVAFTTTAPITAFHGPTPARVETIRFDTTSAGGFTVDAVSLISNDPPVEPPALDKVVNISGVYPHLAMTNAHQECGVGAVVPWAGKLWTMTYGPHLPNGSTDKLYEISSDLSRVIRPESVGGTPANRFIHTASNQLNIGPYFIDPARNVRVLKATGTSGVIPGRITATAAHLTDPNRLYVFTMEDGVYDVNTGDLSYTTRYPDMQSGGDRFLFGYHGKGAYTGQGRLVVANNGRVNNQGVPTGESGVLATWDGTTVSGNGGAYLNATPNSDEPSGNPVAAQPDYIAGWNQVSRTQHCEVTVPGGIYGSANPATDPVWSTGFDAKSVLLHVMEGQQWNLWRLPKGSYTHDGSHGWHTEWPRIRQLDPSNPASMYLMHMHGLFFDFPKTFSATNFAGLKPISSYYKMPTDYAMWDGKIVMGKNDASQFNNSLALKDQSNLWFGTMDDIENWGAPSGHGAVWMNEAVTAGQASDPFFIGGFPQRTLHLRNLGAASVEVEIETSTGTPAWTAARSITVPAGAYVSEIVSDLSTPWVRLKPSVASTNLTAFFHMGSPYPHGTPASAHTNEFAALADIRDSRSMSDGIIRVMNSASLPLEYASSRTSSTGSASTHRYHRIGGAMVLEDSVNPTAESALRSAAALSQSFVSDGGLTHNTGSDAASAWVKQGANTYRLPKLDPLYDAPFAAGWARTARETVTERQMLNLHGTFYEVPRDVSGGMRKMRALATHGKRITDFASWRGLLVLTGVLDDAPASDKLVRNPDGSAALWLGEIDDLWRMGEPRGKGGPWLNTSVSANTASDPYLMYGYDQKTLTMSASDATTITVEVDFLADNSWSTYQSFTLAAGETRVHSFPSGFHAHWVRVKSSTATTASAQFVYGPADLRDAFLDWARDSGLPTGGDRETLLNADSDGDGLANILEYLTGGSVGARDLQPITFGSDGGARIVLRDVIGASGIASVLEFSTNLQAWQPQPAEVTEDPDQSNVPEGFTRYLIAASTDTLFVRLKAGPASN